jgi:hypothetical protein
MGTSKGYSAPTGGAWTKLKRDVSRFARGDSPPRKTPDPRIGNFLSELIVALGGSAAIAHAASRRAAAGVGGGPIGASAARTGAALGGFATAVGDAGLDEALERFDLEDYADRPADEVVDALVERLADVPTGLDDAAAQEALTLLLNELRGDAATKQDLETAYRNAVQTLGVRGLMVRYFGYYLYMLWCRTFIERLNRDPDRPNLAATKSAQVREFILNETATRIGEAQLNVADWTSPEGHAMAEVVLEETFMVFESAG